MVRSCTHVTTTVHTQCIQIHQRSTHHISGAEVVDLLEVGTGPVFLEELNCDGSELTLLECAEKAGPIRAHPCIHTSDVGLSCQGNGDTAM